MIVREHDDEYIMIEQDNHARLSGEMASAWKNSLFAGPTLRDSVEYAISNHDLGWKPFDKEPFWNDYKNMPYTFIDFPVPAKAVLYKQGVEEVAAEDSYAALLCSRHYARFLQNQKLPEAVKFVHEEELRQQRIIANMTAFTQAEFNFHYAMLQFCDNVSLYMCLNDPGVIKKEEHPFFKNGIPVPAAFDFFQGEKAQIQWKDEQTVEMEIFPFTDPINITLKQKTLNKDAISDNGLLKSYQAASWETKQVQLAPMV